MPPSDLRDQLQSTLRDSYTIERELGGGGMSRVFLAEECALGRKVVIKVLPPEMAEQVSSERFKREIMLAARLQHPHIVPLLSAGESQGVPYLTMPFVEGESLRARLTRHGESPVNDAIRMLREIAAALSYAHERGIVHRDIKPDNVLLSGGSAMVTDFGVAKALSASATSDGNGVTSLGVAIGTPAYMAPEQASADPAVDHRADIYALGVLAYELLTGQPPFVGRTPQNLLAAHVTESPEAIGKRRANLPPALAALVMRCLEKRPADRPQSAAEVVHALDDLTTPSGGTAPHSSMPLAAARPGAAGGTARWRIVAAAVVVIVAGVAAFTQWRASGAPELDAHRVAVVPFVNLTGDSALSVVGRVAAEELARSISQTDSADVVASTTVEAALGSAGNAATDAVQRVARGTRASIVVLGSYSKFGDSLRVQASLVDARTGKVIRALDPTTGSIADPMTAIDALRERLLGSIVSDDVAHKVYLGSVPPKYSAYLEHLAGWKMFMKDQRAARPFFERAIAIDSTFVSPYHALATTYSNAGLFDEAELVADRLETQRQRLSSYDRLQLEVVRAQNHYVADEILPLEQQVFARGGDLLHAYLIGYWALRVMKPGVAIKALQLSDSVMTAVGWTGQARDMAQAQHQLGDFRAELAALERGTRLVPAGAASYRNARLRAFAGLGDGAAALALADTLLRSESDPNRTGPALAASDGAREFESHGDTSTAGRLRSLALDWLQQHPTPTPSVTRESLAGIVWFDLRNGDSAAAHLERPARDTGNAAVTAVGYLGIIAAQRGDTSRAIAVADSLGGQTRKWDFGLSTYWRAAILAHLGRRDEAMRFLGEARRHGTSMITWHTHTAVRPLRGYPPFAAMIKPEK